VLHLQAALSAIDPVCAMRVLQVIPAFYPATRYGGPTESVLRLCQALLAVGVEVEVATTNIDGVENLAIPPGGTATVQGVPVHYFNRFPRLQTAPSFGLVRHLVSVARRYDLVHTGGLFNFVSSATPAVLQLLRQPYVISPRGMCRPWALSHGNWLKQPYWRLHERRNLLRAAAVHATSSEEADEIKALLPRAQILVVPNAVPELRASQHTQRAPQRVLFVGRLHPVKGLDVLVSAMSALHARLPDAELVVAGPDDHGEWQRIQRHIESLEPRPRVRYVGPVEGDAKLQLLASASVLALTSHSESFGQVVAEALACGTPVVVSRNCPWRIVERVGAGFWVENESSSVADALERVLTAPDGAAAMSRAALELAATFSLRAVGEAMLDLYRQALRRPGDGSRAR
jgi:glycosyltransferase involved in cell wall biosynthesis